MNSFNLYFKYIKETHRRIMWVDSRRLEIRCLRSPNPCVCTITHTVMYLYTQPFAPTSIVIPNSIVITNFVFELNAQQYSSTGTVHFLGSNCFVLFSSIGNIN